MNLKLTGPQLQYIVNVLLRCPYGEVAELIAVLRQQIEGQQKTNGELTKENYPDLG